MPFLVWPHHILLHTRRWSLISLIQTHEKETFFAKKLEYFVINLQKMFHGHFDRLLLFIYLMNDKGGVNFTPKIFKTSFSSNKDKVVVQYKYRQFIKTISINSMIAMTIMFIQTVHHSALLSYFYWSRYKQW